jgi:two-component system response regulator ResD
MKKKILVVDDEEVIRRVLRICLEKAGYEVKEAENGIRALQAIEQDRADLVISDVVMPGKDGWEVLRELKGKEGTEHIPVILLTAKNQDEDMLKGYELKADYYITKPFTRKQVIYGVKLILEGDSAERGISS